MIWQKNKRKIPNWFHLFCCCVQGTTLLWKTKQKRSKSLWWEESEKRRRPSVAAVKQLVMANRHPTSILKGDPLEPPTGWEHRGRRRWFFFSFFFSRGSVCVCVWEPQSRTHKRHMWGGGGELLWKPLQPRNRARDSLSLPTFRLCLFIRQYKKKHVP